MGRYSGDDVNGGQRAAGVGNKRLRYENGGVEQGFAFVLVKGISRAPVGDSQNSQGKKDMEKV